MFCSYSSLQFQPVLEKSELLNVRVFRLPIVQRGLRAEPPAFIGLFSVVCAR